jgi:hypothetical protein
MVPINVFISLHMQTSGTRAQLEDELHDGGKSVTVGSWGRVSDNSQRVAETASFGSSTWLRVTRSCATRSSDTSADWKSEIVQAASAALEEAIKVGTSRWAIFMV